MTNDRRFLRYVHHQRYLFGLGQASNAISR